MRNAIEMDRWPHTVDEETATLRRGQATDDEMPMGLP